MSEKVRLSALVAQDQLNVRFGGRPASSSSTEKDAQRDGERMDGLCIVVSRSTGRGFLTQLEFGKTCYIALALWGRDRGTSTGKRWSLAGRWTPRRVPRVFRK